MIRERIKLEMLDDYAKKKAGNDFVTEGIEGIQKVIEWYLERYPSFPGLEKVTEAGLTTEPDSPPRSDPQ